MASPTLAMASPAGKDPMSTEIWTLIDGVKSTRRSAASSSLPRPGVLDLTGAHIPAGPYATSIFIQPSESCRQHRRVASSSGTPATHLTTVFDGTTSASTALTAPSRWGPEPGNVQRPRLPSVPAWTGTTASTTTGMTVATRTTVISTAANDRAMASRQIHCEFCDWAGCPETFDPDDVDGWFCHMNVAHLRDRFPRSSACWFCNINPFTCYSPDGRRAVFRARMAHIATHFRKGEVPTQTVRPDFQFLLHVHEQGIIDDATFQLAADASELPPAFSGMPVSGGPRSTGVGGSRGRGVQHDRSLAREKALQQQRMQALHL